MRSLSELNAFFTLLYPRRGVIVLLLSILIHFSALEWANGNLVILDNSGAASIEAPLQAKPVLISLQEPAQTEEKPLLPPKPVAKKKITKKQPKPESVTPQASEGIQANAEPAYTESIETVSESDWIHQPPGNNELSTGSADMTVAAESSELQEPPSQIMQYKTSVPPSAELEYDVLGERKGMVYHGTGTINWESNGEKYAITGKAKALFFTVSEFRSEGAVAPSGIVPVRYMERSGSKGQANTHFDQMLNTISFSSSTIPYPSDENPQDRASIIWQLVAIGRGSPELFKPGTELEMFVAGTRNAETWRIRIIAQEVVELDDQAVTTWHLKSIRQKGSKEKMIDVWLASEQEWYPVKLRHTEANGDYLELSLTNLTLANH